MTSSAEMSLKSRPISTVSVFLRVSWFSMPSTIPCYASAIKSRLEINLQPALIRYNKLRKLETA